MAPPFDAAVASLRVAIRAPIDSATAKRARRMLSVSRGRHLYPDKLRCRPRDVTEPMRNAWTRLPTTA